MLARENEEGGKESHQADTSLTPSEGRKVRKEGTLGESRGSKEI